MSLKLEFEWQDPKKVQGPELQSTWASFTMHVEDQCLTKVFDQDAKTIRSTIYIPLYPLAEWMIWNWWSLLYEPEVSWLRQSRQYAKRHNMSCVGEGISLPDVEFLPLGDWVQVVWKPKQHPYQNVEFVSHGQALVTRQEMETKFYEFVHMVCTRLEQQDITDTWLQSGWDVLHQSLGDEQESAFCKAVSWQGLDPYAMPENMQERFIEVANSLSEGIWEEFFSLTNFENMHNQAEELLYDLNWISNRPGNWDDLKRIRGVIGNLHCGQFPWNQGYDLARTVRQGLGLNGNQFPSSFDILADWFRVSSSELMESMTMKTPLLTGLEAVVGENRNGSPGFILKKKARLENQIFSFGRALCDYLVYQHSPSLVSEAGTERQKRNRAFAAEFLAPAESIQKNISGHEVTCEEIDEIAYHMGVSSFVIEHQVKNHRLAVVKEE